METSAHWSMKYCTMYIICMHSYITAENPAFASRCYPQGVTLSEPTCILSLYFIQAEAKTPKRLDTALRADRSEIPIPYLRVGKRDAEVDAPVMFDMEAEARYGWMGTTIPSNLEIITFVIRETRSRCRGVEQILNKLELLES